MEETRYKHALRAGRSTERSHEENRYYFYSEKKNEESKHLNWKQRPLDVSRSWSCVSFEKNDGLFFVPDLDLAVNMVSTHCRAILAGLMFGVPSVSLYHGLPLLWRGNATSWSKPQRSISSSACLCHGYCVNKMNLKIWDIWPRIWFGKLGYLADLEETSLYWWFSCLWSRDIWRLDPSIFMLMTSFFENQCSVSDWLLLAFENSSPTNSQSHLCKMTSVWNFWFESSGFLSILRIYAS